MYHPHVAVEVLHGGGVVFGRVAYLERHTLHGHFAGKEVEALQGEVGLVGCLRVVAVAYVEYVLLHVLLHHKPGSAAEAESLALAYGVVPQGAVASYHFPGLQFHHVAGAVAQVTPYVVVVVYLSEEADALTVLALGVDEVLRLGYLPYLVLHVVAYGEDGLVQLPALYLCQEVGLILYGVGAGNEPLVPLGVALGTGIVAGGYEVVLVPHLAVEGTKLDEPVAHHVGVGRKSRLYLLHGVACHLVPVFAVAVHHLQPAPVLVCHGGGHLQVFLRRAVPLFLFLGSYLDVEAVGVQPLLCQLPYHHRTVHAAREQHGYAHVLYLFHVFHCLERVS